MEPELIADFQCLVGEGPIWHPMERKVYWVDIPFGAPGHRGKMFWYDPAMGHHQQCYEGDVIGGFTVQADGALLLFMERGAVAVWRDGKLDYLINEIAEERESRFNDVIADPGGRVFCGTMATPERPGRLYRLDPDGSLTVVLENLGIPNGMGFTPDWTGMYFTDSGSEKIYLFDYDEEMGAITNQRVFVDATGQDGFPDGITVDAEGYVWAAYWDGWALHRYSSSGSEERRIPFPTKKVTSLIFGGQDYDDIYVTTAGVLNQAENGPNGGALFRLRLGIRGRPEFLSRIGL